MPSSCAHCLAVAAQVCTKAFKIGDDATVINSFTLALELSDKPHHRKDIIEGTKCIIKGFADEDHRQVLVTMKLKVPVKKSAKKTEIATFVEKTDPKNLELTSVYEEKKKANAISEAAENVENPPSDDEPKKPANVVKDFEWLSNHPSISDPQAEIRVEKDWETLIADKDDNTRVWALKGKISMGLMTLYETLPQYTAEDLVVCHRQNSKGAWKTEVWTNRDFKPKELILAAISTELRDRHYCASVHAIVGLPQQGPSKHPEGKNMALDGRKWQVIAAAKSIDEEEHRGNVFWAIQRVNDKSKEHNLVLENITWEASMTFKLPAGKRRKVDIETKDLPQLPVIVNPKKIDAHTPLVLYQDTQTIPKM